MKKSFVLFLLILGGSWSFQSCKLDPETEEPDPLTLDDVQVAINIAYENLRTYTAGFFNISVVSSDEVIVPNTGTIAGRNDLWQVLHQHTWNPNNDIFLEAWVEAYNGIQNINFALDALKQISETLPDSRVAEARVLRAFYYYLLMDTFGNVPLIDESNFQSQTINQNTRLEIYQFIESEVNEVLLKLENIPNYGRVTQFVAQALLAKLYLNAEIYTGTPQWSKCRDACNDIISSFQVQLENNYFDLFTTNNNQTGASEIIFPAQFDTDDQDPVMDMPRRSLHPAQLDVNHTSLSTFFNFAATPELYNSFDHTNDVRAEAFLIGQQFSPNNIPLSDENGKPLVYTEEISFDNPFMSGARVLKYQIDPAIVGIGGGNNDFAIFRYADILLTMAEALNELNELSDAVDRINQVRDRAYSNAQLLNTGNFNKESLRDQILVERGNELFWEGHRRQDLIRHDKFCDAWTQKPVDADCDKIKLFPIPTAAIGANPNLKQNPGY